MFTYFVTCETDQILPMLWVFVMIVSGRASSSLSRMYVYDRRLLAKWNGKYWLIGYRQKIPNRASLTAILIVKTSVSFRCRCECSREVHAILSRRANVSTTLVAAKRHQSSRPERLRDQRVESVCCGCGLERAQLCITKSGSWLQKFSVLATVK